MNYSFWWKVEIMKHPNVDVYLKMHGKILHHEKVPPSPSTINSGTNALPADTITITNAIFITIAFTSRQYQLPLPLALQSPISLPFPLAARSAVVWMHWQQWPWGTLFRTISGRRWDPASRQDYLSYIRHKKLISQSTPGCFAYLHTSTRQDFQFTIAPENLYIYSVLFQFHYICQNSFVQIGPGHQTLLCFLWAGCLEIRK